MVMSRLDKEERERFARMTVPSGLTVGTSEHLTTHDTLQTNFMKYLWLQCVPSRKSTARLARLWRYAKLVWSSWTGILIKFLFIFFLFHPDQTPVNLSQVFNCLYSSSHVRRRENPSDPVSPLPWLDRQTPILRYVLDPRELAWPLNNGKRGETGLAVS